MSIGVLLRGFIGDMMDFGDVILRTLFPSFMIIQACTYMLYSGNTPPWAPQGDGTPHDRMLSNPRVPKIMLEGGLCRERGDQ